MSHRRPSRSATSAVPPRSSDRRRSSCRLRTALVGVVAGAVLVVPASPAVALPPPPPNPTDSQLHGAQTEKEAAAAEVGRIAGLVAGAEAELERVGVLAEAAGAAYLEAEEALMVAQAAAEVTAAELLAAGEAVSASEARLATFSRDTYMNGGSLSSGAALLDSEGPGELIQRAAILDYVAQNQVDVLNELEVAKVAQANADSAARAARDEMAAAEATAEAAKAQADARLAAQQNAYEAVAAEKAALEGQLQAAQIKLMELQGARNAHEQWQAQKRAEEAAAAAAAARAAEEAAAAAAAARKNAGSGGGGGSGGGAPTAAGYVRPTSGYISSCYGMRWGELHGGIDIAAPKGTPVYAATSGTVVRNGSASGFGLALYIRGDDGAVTVYGHVNREFVSAGDRVVVGEVIAEVGNRGQSTGPHLHFEVHPNGMLHSGRVDPAAWLRARGVPMERC